ncbi:unnamed protein product [Polarella glacialis]|uniref:Uncharacterized protein n=1 Tax=Polarella glacialis TaxID=89957 RepID=A0A813M2K8_POLGL|nr:unnamed protein product [Polarella glacialis]
MASSRTAVLRLLALAVVGSTPGAGQQSSLGSEVAQQCPVFPTARAVIGPAMRCGVSCVGMQLSEGDKCRYDISDCGDEVGAGTFCKVQCTAPFIGTPTKSTCPADNTLTSQEAIFTRPDCDLFASNCPEPLEIPKGYAKDGLGWACATGFAGEAVARCKPAANCASTLALSGCLPKTSCAPPGGDLIGCMLDVTACTSVKPGGMCEVICQFPYVGRPSVAMCHPGNTDSESGLLVIQPMCNLTCPDPPQEPLGYTQDPKAPGGWRCAQGFGGEAKSYCVIDSVCDSRKVMTGCGPLQNCILPRTGSDYCRYDFTPCIGKAAEPGGKCPVSCRAPYKGNATVASCPAGNTNRLQTLDWEAPKCQMTCGEVASFPVGYVSHPYVREIFGWRCVDGYAGIPTWECTTDSACQPTLKMTGCSPLLRCAAPILTAGEQCTFDSLNCLSVRSGEACDVTCKPPYIGGIARAACPPNNTQRERPLLWKTPDCNLKCPMPDPIPAGYLEPVGEDSTEWSCAPLYEGSPKVTCKIGDGCLAGLEFTGCTRQQNCSLPQGTPCSVDWSDCNLYEYQLEGQSGASSVPAGGSCQVKCGLSYLGNITTAYCPASNIDPTRPLDWEFPGCVLNCLDPPEAPGYAKPLFRCSANYSGTPSMRCSGDETCQPTYVFSGCLPEVACAAPMLGHGLGARAPRISSPGLVGADDAVCRMDFSDCAAVQPGGSCVVRCGSAYEGDEPESLASAFCPLSNTDPVRQVTYAEPLCKLKECQDPNPAPAGYEFMARCGWQCAEGYTGKAVKRCYPLGRDARRCTSEAELSGCMKMMPCLPLAVNDTCRVNVSACAALQEGKACNVTCNRPYYAPASDENASNWAICPERNTNPEQTPLWGTSGGEEDLACHVDCPDPDPVPYGHYKEEETGQWLCNGTLKYSGKVVLECTVNETCVPELIVAGCMPIVPCDFPTMDLCEYDVSACPTGTSMGAGSSCIVKCKAPYMTSAGEPHGSLSCEEGNTDTAGIRWAKPMCNIGCANVNSQAGYTKATGVWACSQGYKSPGNSQGAVWQSCVVDSTCISRGVLTGCYPFVNCVPPNWVGKDACMYDANECASVAQSAQCLMRCKLPFVGFSKPAACPYQNIEQNRQLNWAYPECSCPKADPMPVGYEWVNVAQYRCTEGYAGTAISICDVDPDTCEMYFELKGCEKIVPCGSVVVTGEDRCLYNTSSCVDDFMLPGHECNISCAVGHGDNETEAICPSDNVVRFSDPLWSLECVGFECNSPQQWLATQSIPVGYEPGDWQCAEGYRGLATQECVKKADCGGTLILNGCLPLASCILPEVTSTRNRCRVTMENCSDAMPLMPGEFCEVHCKLPFFGTPGAAFCKPNNYDPSTPLTWTEPDCDLVCEDPNPIPTGYVKSAECGWQCAPGYEGHAVPLCDVDEDCRAVRTLTGCTRAENCQVPLVGSFDACRMDFNDCFIRGAIAPGFACQMTCKAPWTGGPYEAGCPGGNTEPKADLTWDTGACRLLCPDPDPVPPGFERKGNDWVCAKGYFGTARSVCIQGDNCGDPLLILSGCNKSTPCVPPVFDDPCMYEARGCSAVQPGDACEIACREPGYAGNRTSLARCPAFNIEANRPLEWEKLQCSMDCKDLAELPEGYAQVPGLEILDGHVTCRPDAIGQGSVRCQVTPDCQAFLNFTGCSPLRNCLPPLLDPCRVILGTCSDLGPGEHCDFFCREPFQGHSINGSCRENNIDKEQLVDMEDEMICHCPDPIPVPLGYAKDGEGWRCAANYTGNPVPTCLNGPDCVPTLVLEGCQAIHACAPPRASLLGDPSQCQRVPSGTICQATCANSACISGGPLTFSCPAENRDPTRQPDLLNGICLVRCEICEAALFTDLDPRPGLLAGTVRFGAVHAAGVMPVSGVIGYRVFWADNCDVQVGQTVGYLPVGDDIYPCCNRDTYRLQISEVELPSSATQLLVAIDTVYGELLHGRTISFQDSTTNASAVKKIRVITNAGRMACHTSAVSWLAAVGAVAALGAAGTDVWL